MDPAEVLGDLSNMFQTMQDGSNLSQAMLYGVVILLIALKILTMGGKYAFSTVKGWLPNGKESNLFSVLQKELKSNPAVVWMASKIRCGNLLIEVFSDNAVKNVSTMVEGQEYPQNFDRLLSWKERRKLRKLLNQKVKEARQRELESEKDLIIESLKYKPLLKITE